MALKLKKPVASGYRDGLLPPHYPLPVNIGRVSLGTDYRGVWFIDDADQDDPVMVWKYDTWVWFD